MWYDCDKNMRLLESTGHLSRDQEAPLVQIYINVGIKTRIALKRVRIVNSINLKWTERKYGRKIDGLSSQTQRL